MNILITGAFGFVGTNLSKAIKVNSIHQSICVDITKPSNQNFDEYSSWNDLNKIDWQNIDAIIHLAGKAHDTKNTTAGKAYFEIYRYGICNGPINCTVTSTLSALNQNQ